jgi:hypothetical protein
MQPPPTPPAPLPPPPELPPFIDFTGRSLTSGEISRIREARELLNEHLGNIEGRRREIIGELRQASGAERVGLELRLQELDTRIARIERDLERTSRMLTNGMIPTEAGSLVAPQDPFSGLPPGNVTAIASVFTIFVLAPIAFAIARLIWRRATSTKPSATGWDSSQRMDRLEHAVDAIAVEVERISEGQRFVTRLLTESPNFGALNSGNRAGEAAPQREAAKVPRDER